MKKGEKTETKSWYQARWVVPVALTAVGGSILIAIISSLMYVAWQSGPTKTLFEAVDYARQSPASYEISMANGSDYMVVTDGVLIAMTGQINDIYLDAIASGKQVYVRSSTPHELLNMLTDKKERIQADWYEGFLGFISDKWLAANIDDFSSDSLASSLLQCAIALRVNISDADNSKQLLKDAYSLNQFVANHSSSNKEKEMTFTFSVDDGKLRSFFGKLSESNFGKMASKCTNLPDEWKDFSGATRFTMTVTKSDHRLKTLTATRDGTELVRVDAKYDEKPEITVPTNMLDLQRLMDNYSRVLETPNVETQ